MKLKKNVEQIYSLQINRRIIFAKMVIPEKYEQVPGLGVSSSFTGAFTLENLIKQYWDLCPLCMQYGGPNSITFTKLLKDI